MANSPPFLFWKRLRAMLTGMAGNTQPQCAALCWRRGEKGVEILMVTSLDTGRWILPKGWPMEGKSLAQAAAAEAWEEAGIKGEITDAPIGTYHYIKIRRRRPSQRCKVTVYALRVSDILEAYPEAGQRKREWVSPEEAAARVDEQALKRLLAAYRPVDDTKLS